MPQRESLASTVLGLLAMIVVGGGLTWLFTNNPPSSPVAKSGSQEQAQSSPLGEKASPPAPVAAVPGHEGPAKISPPSEFAPSPPAAQPEEKLLSFLEHGPDKEASFDLDHVSFAAGKPALTAASHSQLQHIAKVLNAFPEARVFIGVHSSGGSKAQMARLSAERARSVRAELMRFGVRRSLLTATGEGRASHSHSHESLAHDYVWISVSKD